MTIRTIAVAAFMSLALTACGGDSGGTTTPSPGTGTGGGGGTTTPAPDPLTQALETGDTKHVSGDATYLDAILETITDGQSQYNAAKRELFQLSSSGAVTADSLTQLSWDPTHDSGRILPVFPLTSTVLQTNQAREGYNLTVQPMAAIGENEQTRFMAFGTNPFRHPDTLSVHMDSFLDNSLSWLINSDFATARPNVVLAQVDESFYFRDESRTRQWINNRFGEGAVTFNDVDSCDGAALADCLTSADLLIISDIYETEEQAAAIKNTVEQAMNDGVAVLYIHRYWGFGTLSAEILDLLNMRWGGHNYWSRSLVENYNPAELYDALPEDIQAAQAAVQHFKNDDFTADLTQCSNHNCPDDSAFHAEFNEGASSVRSIISAMDRQKLDLFDLPENRLEKLFVLLADKWRQEAIFPMDKVTTNRTTFLKSLFADHINYIHRPLNAAQSDLGNYSRSDFSHITPETRSVTMTAKPNYRASSVYALPGQTFTVTRQDDAAVTTSIQINSIRTGAVHPFDEDGYVRPRYSGASERLEIAPGETLELTSSYGGPIHIYFDSEGEEVRFQFDNVGSHPFWNGPEDDGDFNAALIANDYDWVEFSTPHFEITSTASKFEDTMNHENIAGDTQRLASYITEYHHNIPRYLGGYQGDSIDQPAEMHDFATAHNLDVAVWNRVQHFNADQATCGYGCSGNPYDAWWSFSPLGHGDLHEVGHGLETSRMRFSEWSVHASTNWYSYYPKYRFNQETGLDSGCQSLPYETLFNDLQASQNTVDPIAYMDERDYNGWSNGASIMIQMLAAAEHENVLQDGWMLLPRLHIITRNFNAADNNEETWLAGRDAIGFSGMSRDEALALSQEEWLMIAASHASGRDMSDYFEMWGAILSPTAKTHAQSMGHPKMPARYYAMEATHHCYKALGEATPVEIDGTAAWPITATADKTAQKLSVQAPEEAHPDHGAHEDEYLSNPSIGLPDHFENRTYRH